MMATGQSAALERRFSQADLDAYAALAGYDAGETVPEPLIGALWSCLLGMHLPGIGTMYLKQETEHLAPVSIGETLRAEVVITGLRPEKYLVDLATHCYRGDTLVATGRALVYVRDLAEGGFAPG